MTKKMTMAPNTTEDELLGGPISAWDTDTQQPRAANSLAELAHEIRTPLTAIVAAVEIMKDERLGPIGNDRYLGYARDIFVTARHALAVVDSMLTVTSTTAEQAGCSNVDINPLVDELVSSLTPLAERAGLSIAATLEPALPRVSANATVVRQILLNLLTNALKFTRRGGAIRVHSGRTSEGVWVDVSDTGPGDAPPPRMSREPAIDTAAFVDGPSFGIGLPLVTALAEQIGGRVDVAVHSPAGTTARLLLTRIHPETP